MTIRGVQKMLREEGVKHVASFSQPLEAMAPMRDVTPGEDEVAPGPMAVDVEPEPLDNVVPMAAAPPEAGETSAEPESPAAPEPLPAETPPETAHPGHEPPPEPDLPADAVAAATGDLRPEDAGPDLADEEKLPEFSFLRRTPTPPDAAGDAAPNPISSPRAARRARQPAEAEAPPPPRIPETPGVPAIDAADDDPATPALPGIAARLMTGQIRPDHAAIARAVADLRDLRARL
jgi:resuscitation-promoting factor RpfA